MNILRFINSKAIRDHLKDLHYTNSDFQPLEAAWLIYQCRDATVEEKHAAWRELIETMPDQEIEERWNTEPQKSLHDFLRRYMEAEDRSIARFMDNDCGKSVYLFMHHCGPGLLHDDCPGIYSRFEVIREPDLQPEPDVVEIECLKYRLDENTQPRRAVLTPDLRFKRIDPILTPEEKEEKLLFRVFEGLWFDFPTPFQKGDIVHFPFRSHYCGGPFVLTGVNLERITGGRIRDNVIKNGDTTDMCAAGYFIHPDTGIYKDTMHNYMDLEYYDEDLRDTEKVLIPLSKYVRGEIDVAEYAREYLRIMTDFNARRSIIWPPPEAGENNDE